MVEEELGDAAAQIEDCTEVAEYLAPEVEIRGVGGGWG